MRTHALLVLPFTILASASHAETTSFWETVTLPLPAETTTRSQWIENTIELFSENVASECRKQNLAAQEKKQLLCHHSDCAESFTAFSLPEEFSASVSYNTMGIAMIRVNWRWHTQSFGSTGVCYNPRIAPIVFAFESALRTLPFIP